MNKTGIGLDYLGAKSWSAQITPGEVIESPKEIHKSLPTAILPIQRGENRLPDPQPTIIGVVGV